MKVARHNVTRPRLPSSRNYRVASTRRIRAAMSSPPPLDFPSSDVQMEDSTQPEQSMPEAPPPLPLFLGSPAETPSRPQRTNIPQSSPLRGVMARRALGLNTPKSARTPLFAGPWFCARLFVTDNSTFPERSSSPMAFPSSSPTKTPR